MPNTPDPSRDQEMQAYFSSLPPYVQETIMQCKPDIKTVQELRACAEKLLQGS